MGSKILYRIAIPILCLVSFGLFIACSKKAADEDLIRRAVDEAAKAAEAKDVSGVMKHVSKDYRDDRGNDYNAVKGILVYELLRPGSVRVFITGAEVEVKGDTGLLRAKAVLVRGKDVKSISDVIPEDADGLRFEVVMKMRRGTGRPQAATGPRWALWGFYEG